MTKLKHPWTPGPAKTACGKDVTILTTSARGNFPIVGLVHLANKDQSYYWNCYGKDGFLDLAPPEPERLSGFVNVNLGHVDGIYATRPEADGASSPHSRLACIDLSKHHVGEGLENE